MIFSDRSLKRGILDLHPVLHPAAPVGPTQALADDPLQTHLGRLLEHDSALGLDRLPERDGVDPGDQPLQFRPADLQRQIASILAVEAQEIEGQSPSLADAFLGFLVRRTGGTPKGRRVPDRTDINGEARALQFEPHPTLAGDGIELS
jgi:hypothetical protein